MMKSVSYAVYLMASILIFSSCEVVEGIFKAGFFSAIILGVLLIALIVWVASRLRK
jgi:hypothetical protein